ncbi:hypothetical protein ACWELJ_11315 [Nocardia sp. NPDC004582]
MADDSKDDWAVLEARRYILLQILMAFPRQADPNAVAEALYVKARGDTALLQLIEQDLSADVVAALQRIANEAPTI